ncbi:hypothetical protein [Pseudoalteromonas sp. SWN166]|uniref:hypothetical protein n=1 Tax=Pseudoalteromonas sp. SWN166 TaxID=2792061 RepID=UPI0018CCC77F|nr:hypothetical protein [Pseudoalteromonas sp. SWN166]MBH0039786.1 hypothetical protein [Pseudoalteromonas sp. SWN166]
MKILKTLFLSILTIIVVKIVFGVIGNNSVGSLATNNKTMVLESFLNEFVINNENFTYPIQVDENTTLLSRELKKINDNLFIVENIKLKFDKSELQVSIGEFKELLINEVTPPFCSGLADKDNLFKGYSDVGLIEKIIDSNNEFIMEIKIDKSSC